MAIFYLMLGILLGVLVPHSFVYARICSHFFKCMRERDKKIKELRKAVLVLNMKLIRKSERPEVGKFESKK